jgi:hypothetical protein
MSKEIVKKVGRPLKINDECVNKLEQAFAIGASDTEACSFAGISRQTYYMYLKKNPEFLDRINQLKTRLPMKAKTELARLIQNGNEKAIFWYLDRTDKRAEQDDTNKQNALVLQALHEEELKNVLSTRDFAKEELDRVNEYSLCVAQVKQMRQKLAEEGETLYSEKTGGVYTNPLYNQLQSVQNRMDKLRDILFPVNKEPKLVKDIRDEFM